MPHLLSRALSEGVKSKFNQPARAFHYDFLTSSAGVTIIIEGEVYLLYFYPVAISVWTEDVAVNRTCLAGRSSYPRERNFVLLEIWNETGYSAGNHSSRYTH